MSYRKKIIIIFAFAEMSSVIAGPADLARAPLNFLAVTQAKPNIFFILDNSGSMQSSAIGDEVTGNGYHHTIGYRSSLCNKNYYDPAVTYPVPVRHDGTAFPDQSFTSAQYNGFAADSVTVNLSSDFLPWRTRSTDPSIPENTAATKYAADCVLASGYSCSIDSNTSFPNKVGKAHYFVYKGKNSHRLGDNSEDDHCKDTLYDESLAGDHHWMKVTVGSTSGPRGSDERKNFANWFSYHRTRMLTTKTAVGLAFKEIGEQYRVGFTTIGYSGTDSNHPQFLKIDDFSREHRKKFYDKLYAIHPDASTPLRAALSKAGRLYAGKLLTGDDDPVTHACQQNFSILSTDGYWNTAWETATYGPKKIDGQTDVGDQDHDLPNPKYDGDKAGKPLRVATLTVIPAPTNGSASTTIKSMQVNGQNLITGLPGVVHGDDIETDAVIMAYQVALAVRVNRFRAVSHGNNIMIIAPDDPALQLEAPVLHVEGPFRVLSGKFEDVHRLGRTTNTLADVASYYYRTDLRSPDLGNCRSQPDVCADSVPSAPGIAAPRHQHMITYTLGLGASGTLRYQENYLSESAGDFQKIANGTLSWPDPIFFSGPERIDDLWHAAVNGGGQYFSATNPQSLARVLASAMARIRASAGAAAAAATSSQEPAQGDNLLFSSSYRTIYWDGDLEAKRINLADGTISTTPEWSASRLLSRKVGQTSDQRMIYLSDPASPRGLKTFEWSSLNDTQRDYFNSLCGALQPLSQCASLSATDRALVTGDKLVNYLRGQTGYEQRSENIYRFFRQREHPLGAPINAAPLYVGRPTFRYADENYGAYRDMEAVNRQPMVYLAANDGMLHAFNARSGEELWAFIPSEALGGLRRSADMSFGKNFTYLLDGAPVAADICPTGGSSVCSSGQWRTILVTGLGAAGRSYFALDITRPDTPALLWEFTTKNSANLGYALGKPLVTKRRNGTWVVVLASGYNNINPGNGRGELYVLDAFTGRLLDTVDTGEGTVDQPSGLAHLNAWVDNALDNTALRFYGADLLGNLWRFDIDDLLPPEGKEAVRLARFMSGNDVQPVTTRVELSEIRSGNIRVPVITAGTGRQLGLSDLSDRSVQSLYTLKDPLTAEGFGDVRQSGLLVPRRLEENASGQRSILGDTIDWLGQAGWYLDFDRENSSGERVTIDPDQQSGVIRVVTNVLDNNICRPHAQSWIYKLDYQSGLWPSQAADSVAGQRVFNEALAVGARTIKVGEKTMSVITNDSGGIEVINSSAPTGSAPTVRRVSWQELDEP